MAGNRASTTADVIIVGGGISGLLSARELADAGARVCLLERQALAQESSWAGGGILSPLYPWRYPEAVTRLAQWSQQHYAELATMLHESTGFDPQYRQSGLLMIAADTDQAMDWAHRYHYSMQCVDRKQITQIEPALAAVPEQALWLPDTAQVRNPRLMRALIADLCARNVAIQAHTVVEHLLFDSSGQRVIGVHAGGQALYAAQVLICAGAWSAALLPEPQPDIRPVRGQMVLFDTPAGTIQRIVLEDNRYIIPRRDGKVLFGSTLEDTGFDKSTTKDALIELKNIAIQRFPVLGNCAIEKHWAGLRPASPAGIPYIGKHPHTEGLFFNAGHFRNGVVLGPASARLVTDLMLDRSPILDPKPYALLAVRH